jgi:hypothetical protein
MLTLEARLLVASFTVDIVNSQGVLGITRNYGICQNANKGSNEEEVEDKANYISASSFLNGALLFYLLINEGSVRTVGSVARVLQLIHLNLFNKLLSNMR